ncbi:MAG: cytochrome c oxidase subunit 3, partial [Planctomycetota bacterium]
MSEQSQHPHHDDPWSHVPPPSYWPVLLGLALCILPFGILASLGLFDSAADALDKGEVNVFQSMIYPIWASFAAIPGPLLLIAILLFCFTLMGWGHQIIREKAISHDLVAQQKDLKWFTLLFFVSEAAAFGAVFAYLYVQGLFEGNMVRPEHIHLGGPMVALATILLLGSSVTCEVAHRAMHHGHPYLARMFLLLTIACGVIFLGAQAYEYGDLIVQGFTPRDLGDSPYNAFAALFYISTGFHGLHVATGLVMLFLVYLRMEFGHFTQQRHFSFIAASWYWHFVDVI